MADYPFLRDDGWTSSELEDYRRAKDDCERRQLLCIFGYDKAHQSDYERLFLTPEPEPDSDPPNWPKLGFIVALLTLFATVLFGILSLLR